MTTRNPLLLDEGRRLSHQPRQFRYKVLNEISRGTYGVVYRARDIKTGEIVALKWELGGLCKSTMMEIQLMKSLTGHPSIVEFKTQIRDVATNAIYVVMEYMHYDLKGFLKESKPFVSLLKHVMKKLLEGVAFIHSKGVMHRDLKPGNILININTSGNYFDEELIKDVKICDFGMAAKFGGLDYNPKVGTRYYKAPELLAGSRQYSSAVDMWSVGCIMVEMVLGRVLFAGVSSDRQLGCIHQVISPRDNHIRLKMASEVAFSGATRLTREGLDLLERLLQYDPNKRITASDALKHAWFTEVLP